MKQQSNHVLPLRDLRDRKIELNEWPLLKQVFDAHQARLKNPKCELSEGIESGEEIELRYEVDYEVAGITCLEDIDAFTEGLRRTPGVYVRQIHQVSVKVYTDKTHKEEVTFRLRKTSIIFPPGHEEQNWYRIALKTRTRSEDTREGTPIVAKEETSLILRAGDPEVAADRKDFDQLFQHKSLGDESIRVRTYVRTENGEVHMDHYSTPSGRPAHSNSPDMADTLRIEREFQGDNKMGDAIKMAEKGDKKDRRFLWIGKQVTGNSAWNNKSLVKEGPPKDFIKRREGWRAKSRKGARKQGLER